MLPIVMIGSGMASYTLAREFRKLNAEQPVILVTQDDGANYSKPNLSTAFTLKKTAEALQADTAEGAAAKMNITIRPFSTVTNIDSDKKELTIRTAEGEEILAYQAVVLATGATPIRLPIEGDGAEEALSVNTLDDYKKFRAVFGEAKDKTVLVIGAGLIGTEFAHDLINAQSKAIVVDLSPTVLGRLLPAEVATVYQSKLEAFGIQFELGTTVQSIVKSGEQYQVTLQNGKSFTVDIVLSAVGLRPNIALATAAGIECNRGIRVGELLQTNLDDVYAIGDCAEVLGHVLPYVMPIMQQGRALSQTLNGNPTKIIYPAMPVGVKTPACPLVVCPPPVEAKVTWSFEETEDGMIAKATHEGTLKGFVLLGATAGKQRMALTKEVPDLVNVG